MEARATQGKFRKGVASLRRLWSMRPHYAHKLDWLRSIYNRVLLHLPRLPLPGRNDLRKVRLTRIPEPFYVRMNTTDWYVLEEIFIDEVYAPAISNEFQGVRNVIDLGANTGFSVRLWQMAYPSARIIAVEPDAANLKMCRQNAFKRGGHSQLHLLQACVVGRSRAVAIDRSRGAWEFRLREADTSSEVVEGLTLAGVLERCEMSGTVDLLKCDIEGAEAEVFADCAAWINRVRNLVIEIHTPYTRESFTEDLLRAGWSFEIYHSMQCQGASELLFLQQTDLSASRNLLSATI